MESQMIFAAIALSIASFFAGATFSEEVAVAKHAFVQNSQDTATKVIEAERHHRGAL